MLGVAKVGNLEQRPFAALAIQQQVPQLEVSVGHALKQDTNPNYGHLNVQIGPTSPDDKGPASSGKSLETLRVNKMGRGETLDVKYGEA